MAKDWQMPRAGAACAGCGRPFEVGEEFRALLFEMPEGYERRDYCPACTPPAEPAPVGTWKTHRPVPASASTPVFDREAMYNFFLGMEGAEHPEKVRLRFVLALVLWRKKVLNFLRSDESDGREYWEFAVVKSDETHRVERPEIAEEQLEELSTQLERLLAGEAVSLADPSEAMAEEPADG